MAAASLGEHLIGWLHSKAAERKIFCPHGPALRVYSTRGKLRGTPAAVVTDNNQDRQVVHGRHHVASAGYTKQIGAVADDRDNGFFGRAQLHPQRTTDAPT